jgi:transposase
VSEQDPKDVLIAELRKENETLRQQLAAAHARIAELEAMLRRHFPGTSGPSPQPPQPPHKKAKRRRKRGGQPGHPPHVRTLLPPEQVTEVKALVPASCSRCQAELVGQDPAPQLHQVVELPPVSAHVTEYQLHRLSCTRCGATNRARLPDGVPSSPFGPRLCALMALCTGCYRMSKRNLEQFLRDVLGIKLCLGSISAVEQRVSDALEAPMQQALEALPQQAVANCDETSWRQSRQKAWLWVAVTAVVTVFRIAKSRGACVCKELLGESFGGTLGSDRWSAYSFIPLAQRQLCWAHLLRDFEELCDAGGDGARLGRDLLRLGHKVMRLWHRVRDGTLPFAELAKRISPLRSALGTLLQEGVLFFSGKARALCRDLQKKEVALWRFTQVPGVEPTNNSAERALRHAVLWRRCSFGTDSRRGADFVERILTVTATLRKQGRCVLSYLTAACLAPLNNTPAPPLLPLPQAHA